MKLLLVVLASALFSVLEATPEDEKKLQEDLIKGVVEGLDKLAKEGKKYDLKEAENMLTQIVAVEAVKNAKLIEKIGNDDIPKVISKVLAAPEVTTAFNKILKDGVKPRVIGAVVMGLTQLISDFVTMLLTRNA